MRYRGSSERGSESHKLSRSITFAINAAYAVLTSATFGQNADKLLRATLNAMLTILVMLTPILALLLKLFQLSSGRGYLEHLVVALYSHSYLSLVGGPSHFPSDRAA